MNAEKKRRLAVTAAVNCVFLIAFAVLAAVLCGIKSRLPSQLAAERWSADSGERYSQLSVFYSQASGINIDTVYTMRVNIEKKLTENSVAAKEPGARVWYDGYSALTSLTVTSPREDYTIRADADVIATGGDYFMIHPLKLLSGYYYSDDDLMQDRVLLDESLAWQLFGSNDIAGMTVIINGRRFYVAGVVEADSDKASRYVYGEKPHMYISYEGLKNLNGGETVPVTCYEAVIPDPVSGLARSITEGVITAGKNSYKLTENSDRYSLKNLFGIAFDGGKRSVIDTEIAYPFWENAARINEDNAATVLVWASAMLIVPLLTVMYFVFLLIHKRKAIAHKAAEKIKSSAEKIKVRIADRKLSADK